MISKRIRNRGRPDLSQKSDFRNVSEFSLELIYEQVLDLHGLFALISLIAGASRCFFPDVSRWLKKMQHIEFIGKREHGR